MKITNIRPNSREYTSGLAEIPNPPEQLFYRGELPKNRQPTVAIVGSRRPTTYGREISYNMAYELAKRGVVIVSGLAFGVDSIAHKAALDSGGATIAVLASGVRYTTPRSHQRLADQIVDSGGAIISESEGLDNLMAHNFLQRNRLVSGLADVLIIIEAASRSGTLSTAAHALDQGREVFALPGNITNPLSAGCNKLIKQGAMPLLSVDDVLDVVLPSATANKQQRLPLGDTDLETAIIKLLSSGVRDGDELLKKSEATASDFAQSLTMLELNAVIKPLGANRWTLR